MVEAASMERVVLLILIKNKTHLNVFMMMHLTKQHGCTGYYLTTPNTTDLKHMGY